MVSLTVLCMCLQKYDREWKLEKHFDLAGSDTDLCQSSKRSLPYFVIAPQLLPVYLFFSSAVLFYIYTACINMAKKHG